MCHLMSPSMPHLMWRRWSWATNVTWLTGGRCPKTEVKKWVPCSQSSLRGSFKQNQIAVLFFQFAFHDTKMILLSHVAGYRLRCEVLGNKCKVELTRGGGKQQHLNLKYMRPNRKTCVDICVVFCHSRPFTPWEETSYTIWVQRP